MEWRQPKAVVIGAGMGGLSAAIDLARHGWAVTVLERTHASGGKMREVGVGSCMIDSGPTVLTMAGVFESLFADAGEDLLAFVSLCRLNILARHAWRESAHFDLFADRKHAAEAISDFAGAREGRAYLAFCRDAQRMFETLRPHFLEASKPTPLSLAARIGLHRIGALLAIRPFDTLWTALGGYFKDMRLRQLFGRYATYCGSSPFAAPATLMLIAHVEQDGVWTVAGGMQRLAEAMESLAKKLGVGFRFGESAREIDVSGGRANGVKVQSGEHFDADAIVCNADSAALASGAFGPRARHAVSAFPAAQRSLSAITWAARARATGFPLLRHNVFFSQDYAAEFRALRRGGPNDPTIYVCAQDRADEAQAHERERLLILMNMPAQGDTAPLTEAEITACQCRVMKRLEAQGLNLECEATLATTPTLFNTMFPATGGALYGRATHGWTASFLRPGSRTKIQGLYLAGGSAHPGAGVPMAALSGRLAAQRILADRASTPAYHRAAMRGGTSTRSATMRPTA